MFGAFANEDSERGWMKQRQLRCTTIHITELKRNGSSKYFTPNGVNVNHKRS